MTKEEHIALDQWREDEARRISRAEQGYITSYEIYRRLVRDDVRPPVVEAGAQDVFSRAYQSCCDGHMDKAIQIIRTYGDERHAEGERAGIERVLAWLDDNDWNFVANRFRSEQQGEQQ